MEAGESDVETALRETFEEIGIPAHKIDILGKLSSFYVEVSGFEVQPIVGWLNAFPQTVLNKDEVEKILFFPLQNFKPPHQELQLNTLTGKLSVPCVQFENEIIWGATAMILSEFYDLLTTSQ
jgi:8-oxo-dGTP pyrophosphatase MutT (NUDIX family)